jgi:outer membrane protein TolC
MRCLTLTLGILGCLGCAGKQHWVHRTAPTHADGPVAADETPARVAGAKLPSTNVVKLIATPVAFTQATSDETREQQPEIQPPTEASSSPEAVTVTPVSSILDTTGTEQANESLERTYDLNLPTALAMVGGQHPAVGFAQSRVQEAYAQLARAEAMWLPTIQAGASFHRHDGNTQTTAGQIVDLNRNSFQYGLGTGANAAGTTPNPGLVAQFHLADAIFQPKINQRTAWARGHAANAVVNQQLLNAALAYIELVDAYQDVRILEESRARTAELSKITDDFAEAGAGLRADANRLQTELSLVDNRLLGARERIAVASARLSQAISLDGVNRIVPLDVMALPIDMVSADVEQATLISTGLASRPELKESQALVAAACEAYRREKVAPFVPSMLLGFSTGGFGGGLGNDLSNVEHRYDFDAVMTWQVRNMGIGEQAVRRENTARVQQARFEKIRVMDQVARDISESHSQVQFRRQQIALMERAIAYAQSSFDLNLERIRDGEGLPLEVLQSVQALETARRTYLRAVIDYNQSQFRLQWALGWPVTAPASLETDA